MTRWPPRPALSRSFYKAHGLGNDYLVFEEGEDWLATPANVRRACDRHRGVGGDGVVALLDGASSVSEDQASVALRMYNPDGGEFERSGNGLRILGSYLARSTPTLRRIDVRVGGDEVSMVLHGRAGPVHDISVEMGQASVGPAAVGLDPSAVSGATGPAGSGAVAGAVPHAWLMRAPDAGELTVVPVSVGNPHMVVLVPERTALSERRLAEIGPFLASHPALSFGANVQLAWTDEGGACRALVWERGVGRTEASGTSACAVAAAMVATGRTPAGPVRVEMPGGTLAVLVGESLGLVLRGPVEEVLDGALSPRLLATFERAR